MTAFHLTVATPQGKAFDGDVVNVSLRGTLGDLAIMAGHIPFTTRHLRRRVHDPDGRTDEKNGTDRRRRSGRLGGWHADLDGSISMGRIMRF